MLKTTTKKARENIKKYIIDNYTPDGYGLPETTDFTTISKNIYDIFQAEYITIQPIPQNEKFISWCAGLPSILDTCYYYNRSAVDDLANILEETDEEKSKYSETEAERLLSYLIFREINRARREAK